MINFKEIIRLIFLLAIIIILFIIALYEYIPNSKIIEDVSVYSPKGEITTTLEEVSEVTSGNLKEEIVMKSYKVTGKDLNIYENIHKYNSGRGNPFENVIYYSTTEDESTSTYYDDNEGSSSTSSSSSSTGYFTSTGKNK